MRLVTPDDAYSLLAVLPRCLPLPNAEIDRCEADAGVPFAADFRRLLRLAGGSLGWLFPGGLDHPSQVARLRADAAELSVGTGWSLGPADIVVEFWDQGYGMTFIRGAVAESRVFRYLEGTPGPEDTGLSLGLYLAAALERHLHPDAEPGAAADTGRM